MKIRPMISILSLLAGAACSSGGGGGFSATPPTNASDSKTVLEGTWMSACTLLSSGDYQINTLTVAGGQYTMTMVNYGTSAGCVNKLFTFYSSGAFALDATGVVNPVGAKSVDFTSTALLLTPDSNGMTSALNGAAYCGVTNWTTGFAVQLLGKTCDGKSYPASGYVDYSIYKVSGNTLWLGDESQASNDGSDPSKRPVSWDALTLTKQ